ncbi:MAG: hypothetical protein ACLP1X_33410 [Polyangiaceae bacterium]|jgi:hypothetical protein
MKSFQNDEALLYILGLGLNFGAQPDYSDLTGAPPTPPPPGPPPPPPPPPGPPQ